METLAGASSDYVSGGFRFQAVGYAWGACAAYGFAIAARRRRICASKKPEPPTRQRDAVYLEFRRLIVTCGIARRFGE